MLHPQTEESHGGIKSTCKQVKAKIIRDQLREENLRVYCSFQNLTAEYKMTYYVLHYYSHMTKTNNVRGITDPLEPHTVFYIHCHN